MDAGIEIKEVRYPYDETWGENSKKLQQQGITRTRKLPGQDLPIRVPCSSLTTRQFQWVANLTEKSEKYKNEVAPEYYNLLDQYYRDQAGPYLLGNSVTYVDFAVYQSIDNDERTGTLPVCPCSAIHDPKLILSFQSSLPESLIKFREAFEQRPNIAAYLKATRLG
ncbi:unnamed protein product [Aspergillus oryzae]|nr:unnamed protein product [Aspergillus oryzae]GMF94210.1 unnamed protein product [Aspergillus oryzae]